MGVKGFVVLLQPKIVKTDYMNISHETTGNMSGIIKLEITQDDYEQQYQKELREHRRKAVMPGFRPGKVPVSIIEKKYGTALLVEEVNKVVSSALENYIRDNNLDLLGYPLARPFDKGIDFTRDRDFTFSFDIAFIPEINVDLSAFDPIEKYAVQVDDDTVQPFIDRAVEEQGEFVEKEKIEAGDFVEIQIDELDENGQIDEDGISNLTRIELASITDESFREKLIGSQVAQSFNFDPLKITKSPEAAANMLGIEKEEAEKISTQFSMEIMKIEHFQAAEMNEDFYKTIFPNDQINTEEEFKERMRQEVKRYYDGDVKHIFARRAFDQLIEINDLQLPEEFLKKWLFANNDGKMSMEEIEKDYEGYQSGMKLQLIQDALMKKYLEISVSDHDVRSEIMDQFRRYFSATSTLGADDEELNKQLVMFADNYMDKHKQEVHRIHDQIFNERIADVMNENVQQKVVEVTPDELKQKVAELSESDNDDHDHDHDHTDDQETEHDSEVK